MWWWANHVEICKNFRKIRKISINMNMSKNNKEYLIHKIEYKNVKFLAYKNNPCNNLHNVKNTIMKNKHKV